ncbi:MAG: YegS/Rv2252/BmrU family lipid kinase, partial [Candidatus Eremiobacteraeota bacterium]|nr:YegS/Rv2252/BmrU family lipid kinase [Candidatus Eremiobacteraeota bacterium]
ATGRSSPAAGREIVLLGNPHSRETSARFGDVQRALEERGVRIAECHIAEGKALNKIARRGVKNGAPYIAIAGGDGSMTRAVEELAHSETALGVIPMGTGNSFAQSLGIAKEIDTIADTIAFGDVRAVDVGTVNGLHFANFATIGLSSVIAGTTPNFLKRIFGTAAYVLSGVVPALRSRAFQLELELDDDEKAFKGAVHQAIVASGRYFGDKPLLPKASVLSGRLAVFTTTSDGVPGIAHDFIAIALGKESSIPQAHWWTPKRVCVRAKPKQLVAIDGEVLCKTPADFRIDRGALRVLVPTGFDGYP